MIDLISSISPRQRGDRVAEQVRFRLQPPPPIRGSPLMRHLVVGYDNEATPVRCMVTLAASDVARLAIDEDDL